MFAKECGLDETRCIKMALCHDIQEATVGDITPYQGVSEQSKHEMEMKACTAISQGLQKQEIIDMFAEFEDKTTPEAQFVAECDKLDMLIQAWIYEEQQHKNLEDFFAKCALPRKFTPLVEIRKQIEAQRAARK